MAWILRDHLIFHHEVPPSRHQRRTWCFGSTAPAYYICNWNLALEIGEFHWWNNPSQNFHRHHPLESCTRSLQRNSLNSDHSCRRDSWLGNLRQVHGLHRRQAGHCAWILCRQNQIFRRHRGVEFWIMRSTNRQRRKIFEFRYPPSVL